MKLRTFSCALVALGAFSAVGSFASCSDQPKPTCATARGPFAARYKLVTLVSGTGCDKLTGDVLGVQTYNGSNPDGTPNWDDASMAIVPLSFAGNGPSIGHFSTANPDGDGYCSVPTMNATEVHIPAVTSATTDPASGMVTCPSPAVDVKYEWSNVRVHASADVLGTEFKADLTYTDFDAACTAQYRVWAVYPVVQCSSPGAPIPPPEMDAGPEAGDDSAAPDGGAANDEGGTSSEAGTDIDASATEGGTNDGGATGDGGSTGALPPECQPPPPTGPATYNDAVCSPYPSNENNSLGSGINVAIPIECDHDFGLCLPPADKVQ